MKFPAPDTGQKTVTFTQCGVCHARYTTNLVEESPLTNAQLDKVRNQYTAPILRKHE